MIKMLPRPSKDIRRGARAPAGRTINRQQATLAPVIGQRSEQKVEEKLNW